MFFMEDKASLLRGQTLVGGSWHPFGLLQRMPVWEGFFKFYFLNNFFYIHSKLPVKRRYSLLHS